MVTHEGKGKYDGNSWREREIWWQLMKEKGNIMATHERKGKDNGNSWEREIYGNSWREREIWWQLMKEKGNIMATHEGKGKYNGNSWYKKFIHVVKVFEIRDADTSNLWLRSSKNIPVLSLTKTIKNSSNNESFLLRPDLLTFSFWYFIVPSSHLSVPSQKSILLAFSSTHLNAAISAS